MMIAPTHTPEPAQALLASAIKCATSLPDLTMRRAVMHERLRASPPQTTAAFLHVLSRRSLHIGGAARSAMFGTGLALIELRYGSPFSSDLRPGELQRDPELLDAIRDAAEAAQWPYVAALVSDLTSPRSLPPRARLHEVAISATSLRSQLGPTSSGFPDSYTQADKRRYYRAVGFINKLAKHHDPEAIHHILASSGLMDMRHILEIAAKRPTTLPIALEVVRSLKWIARPAIRAAVVTNPCTPPALAIALAPTVALSVVRDTARAEQAHPRVLEALLSLL